jgi:hypothetical protein
MCRKDSCRARFSSGFSCLVVDCSRQMPLQHCMSVCAPAFSRRSRCTRRTGGVRSPAMCASVQTCAHPFGSAPQCEQAMQLLLDLQPLPAAVPFILEMRKNLCCSQLLRSFFAMSSSAALAFVLFNCPLLFPSLRSVSLCQVHAAGATRRLGCCL